MKFFTKLVCTPLAIINWRILLQYFQSISVLYTLILELLAYDTTYWSFMLEEIKNVLHRSRILKRWIFNSLSFGLQNLRIKPIKKYIEFQSLLLIYIHIIFNCFFAMNSAIHSIWNQIYKWIFEKISVSICIFIICSIRNHVMFWESKTVKSKSIL